MRKLCFVAVAMSFSSAMSGCSAISLDDEAQDWTKECEAMRSELKSADDPAAVKKVYKAHKDALIRKVKAVKSATKWIGMSAETNKAYNACRGDTRSLLEINGSKKLSAEYSKDVLDL